MSLLSLSPKTLESSSPPSLRPSGPLQETNRALSNACIPSYTRILTDHTHTPVTHAAVFPFLLAGYPPVECQSTVFSSPASWQLVRGRVALGSLLSSLGSGEDRLTGWHMLDPTSTRHCGALCLSAWLGVHRLSRRSHHLPPL